MRLLALSAWAASETQIRTALATPPVWHVRPINDALIALSGLLWSTTYILMARAAFTDRTAPMPLLALALNLAWELVYGYVYAPATRVEQAVFAPATRVEQAVFAQWAAVNLVVVYATVRFGGREWAGAPMVRRHLGRILLVGVAVGVWLHLAVAGTLVPSIGRQVLFYTAWSLQLVLGVGLVAQLMSRGHSRGHSWAIWWCRMLGTLAAAGASYWGMWFWPELYGYMGSPLGVFLLVGSHLADALYPFVLVAVRKAEVQERLAGKGE